MAEEKPFAFAACNAEISFTRFAGTVDHTPHDCNGEWLCNSRQALFDLCRHPAD